MEKVQVIIEYCGLCGHEDKCHDLQKKILKLVPEAQVQCKKGRQGSFEVSINDEQVYSKLSTMAFPDYEDVAKNVQNAENGDKLTPIRQQKITDCVIQ
ncbi:uncharacterized protein DMENIID0001_097150 [Sergentomyia squamirostris]